MTAPPPPAAADRGPEAGDVLGGRYEIREELGRGGMATVYRGVDLRLRRPVAVKVFRGSFAEAVDPQRTAQEMRLLASVSHPSVVGVLDASNGDGVHGAYLVMELVVGDDLGALLHRARGALAADRARRIVADVAAALAALHAQGVVHRDVKPANILVPEGALSPTSAVAAKLTDFGIAQLVDGARMTGPESILGTAAYLSPEQVRGMPPQPASDVYSLGLVLLEALTGARAFPGPAAEAAMARLHRPPALPQHASPALADLLSRMTALDPERRPAAADVAAMLRGRLVGGVVAPDAVQTAPTPIAGLPMAGLVSASRAGDTAPDDIGPGPAGAEVTAPHEPLFTPSRGMPLGTGRVPVPSGVVPVPAAGRAEHRFPTVLAVAASALAAAVAGVAITAFAGATVASGPAGAAAPRTSSSTPAPGRVAEKPAGDVAGYREVARPRPAVSSPSPTSTRITSSPTPTPSATGPVPEPASPSQSEVPDVPEASVPPISPTVPESPPPASPQPMTSGGPSGGPTGGGVEPPSTGTDDGVLQTQVTPLTPLPSGL